MKLFLLFVITFYLVFSANYLRDIKLEIEKNDKIMQEKAQALTDTLIKLHDTTRSN